MNRLQDCNLTQQQLADYIGVRRATVSEWATGKSLPHLNPESMARLCIALECGSIFDLMKLFDDESPTAFDLIQELAQKKILLERG